MAITLEAIKEAVERNGGNKSAAARELGVTRQAVHSRLLSAIDPLAPPATRSLRRYAIKP